MDAEDETTCYRFAGWDLDGDGKPNAISATSVVNINATAIMQEQERTYIITFMNGENVYHQVALPFGVQITLPSAPIKDGMVFLGWSGYEDAMTVTGELTLEAQWHTHTIYSFVVEPTCTEQGYTANVCGCGYSKMENYVNKKDHSFTHYVSDNNASCLIDGTKTAYCDLGCGTKETVADTGSATGHALGQWTQTKAPKCTEKGEERRDCAHCDYFVTRALDETGHSYSSVVTDPDCTEQGYTTYTCACGSSYVDNYTTALGHSWDLGVVIQAPSEGVAGQRKHTCDRCQKTKVEPIPALDHVHGYTSVVTKPTCTAQGYTTHTCHCGHSYVDTYMDALGHSFTNYISDGNATTEADGTKTAYCDRGCGAKDTVADPGSMVTKETITSDIYIVTEQYISKISIGTTVADLCNGIHEKTHIKVFLGEIEVTADAIVGTGMKVRLIQNGQTVMEREIVVAGDVNGDGKITVTDMIAIKSHVLKKSTLENAYGTAADVSGDKAISITDFIQIKAHILGKSQVQPRVATVSEREETPGTPTRQEPQVTVLCVSKEAPVEFLVPEKRISL